MEARRAQLDFADGLIADEVTDLWEDWMRPADQLLDDDQLLTTVYEALAKRRPHSRTRGRLGTPAEVVLRLLLLRHIRNWSYEVVEREVRANLVYRSFTRVGGGKVPDDTVMNKWALALGPEVIENIHKRVVAIAREKKVVAGRKLRVDTTVVEANIHYPTDSGLLGDGVRVLTRAMKRIAAIAGEAGAKLRDRSRSVKHRILEIGRAARSKGGAGQKKLQQGYRKLLEAASRVVGQAKRFSREIETGVKSSGDVLKQAALEGLRKELDTMAPRVRQVMQQARARVFGGDTRVPEKLVSIFEPDTEVIRKGKASKPTEFGKMVKIQEAENQIITSYEVSEKRPSDSALLIPAIASHEEQLGRVPRLVAGDAAFYSAGNEKAAHDKGVKRVCVPNRNTTSAERKQEQKKPWFRQGQKWRTGCEGRISVVKRRHGLNRCRDKGQRGMRRWVGFGVIADNLINIGRLLSGRESAAAPAVN
ncbi:MAG: ISNCY family transposase [Bryobacteraceae bacterium]|nr:ISNCY family transposase [Bryobacteraceae bacterium]